VLILVGLLNQAEQEAAVEARSKAVIACANDITRATIDATTAAGAYKIMGNPVYVQRADLAIEALKSHEGKLRELLKDNPARLKDLKNVSELVNSLFHVVSMFRSSGETAESTTMEGLIGRGKNFRALNSLVAKLGITTNSLIADELKVQLESPVQKARTREAIKRVLIGGVAFNIVLAFVLATYFSRSVTKRLLIVRENTERLARRAELVPAIGGVDEIADLDAAFHKAADRLEELEQFKQQLIGIVSHELKTPLSSMQVNIALMREGATGELPDKAQNKVRVLESNVGRLIRLINDLLDIEKLESGKFELILRECKLKNIVETSLDATSEFASRRKIEIVAPVTDLVLHADQDRIVQVLINFLSNAVKYSAEGSQVVVDVAEVEDLVEVRVKDSGRGIPATHIEKIFDRFQQVEKTDETEKGGTGLGLAISKAIIEQHPGGKIGVDSKLGEGSTFWFRVKKWKAEEIVEALQVVAG
jgi:signal transduction histidine kinase